jgi:hypothetical protein
MGSMGSMGGLTLGTASSNQVMGQRVPPAWHAAGWAEGSQQGLVPKHIVHAPRP